MIQRKIARIATSQPHQGFLGPGHTAAAIVDSSMFLQSDPFIMLMDDRLDLPGGPPVGGAHPHAGFETVTLVIEGDGKTWETGSLEVMTAGKGIIHTEEITAKTQMHILQLWLVLPPEKRWTDPRLQKILLEDVPKLKALEQEIRVYSGSSNGLESPLENQTAFTLVDFKLGKASRVQQQIPASYNGFIYVLEGSVKVGDTRVQKAQSAWFDQVIPQGESSIDFITEEEGARFILYAGEPQKAPIVSYGPFIGNSKEDIARLYHEYNRGQIPHLNDLPETRKVLYRA